MSGYDEHATPSPLPFGSQFSGFKSQSAQHPFSRHRGLHCLSALSSPASYDPHATPPGEPDGLHCLSALSSPASIVDGEYRLTTPESSPLPFGSQFSGFLTGEWNLPGLHGRVSIAFRLSVLRLPGKNENGYQTTGGVSIAFRLSVLRLPLRSASTPPKRPSLHCLSALSSPASRRLWSARFHASLRSPLPFGSQFSGFHWPDSTTTTKRLWSPLPFGSQFSGFLLLLSIKRFIVSIGLHCLSALSSPASSTDQPGSENDNEWSPLPFGSQFSGFENAQPEAIAA